MLIPRHVVIEIDEKYPDAGVRHTIESYIEYRNKQKRQRATSDIAPPAGWTAPEIVPEPSTEERLEERMAKIEGDLGEVKDMLKQLLAQNAGTN